MNEMAKEESLSKRALKEEAELGLKEAERLVNQSPEKAYACANESYKKAQMLKDTYLEAVGLFSMGRSQWLTGKFEAATYSLTLALNIAEAHHYSEVMSKSHNILGNIYLDLEKYDRGLEHYRKSIKEADKLDSVKLKAIALNNIGEIYRKLGLYDKAIEYYNQSMEIEKHLGQKENIGVAILNIGDVYHSLRDYDKAEAYAEESLGLFTKYKNYLGVGYSNHLLGQIKDSRGEYELAKSYYSTSFFTYLELNDKIHQIIVLIDMGKMYLKQGDEFTALANINEAYRLSEALKVPHKIAEVCSLLANLHENRNAYEEALYYYKKFHDIEKQVEKEKADMRLNVILGQLNMEQSIQEKEIYRLKNVELKNKTKELKSAYKRVANITAIGKEITSTLDLEVIAQRLYIQINKLMDAHLFGIGIYREQSQKISYRLFIEKGHKVPESESHVDDKASIAAWCIRNQKEVVIANMEREKRKYIQGEIQKFHPKEEEIMSLVYIPIVFEKKPIGILSVQSTKKRAYTKGQIELLRALAAFVAIALNNAQKSLELEREVKERKEAECRLQLLNDKLFEISNLDGLTGIPNRRQLEAYIENIGQKTQHIEESIAVMIVDIDFFKQYNDQYGHLSGDDVIKKVAKALKVSLKRDSDLLARYGGDEFMIILQNTKQEGIEQVIRNIRENIGMLSIEHQGSNVQKQVTVTIGVAYEKIGQEKQLTALIEQADRALYEAKAAGRNGYKILGKEGWREE